ncbi:MAG: trigger factor [Myxococcales bacterium]|nr:trigger factor [Myxococcales bacterium]
MQVNVSRVSPVEVSLRVSLPADRVSAALDRAYNEVGREAQLRGFRKGKVPRNVLKQVYGPQVTSDVLRRLIDETLPGAISAEKLEVIGQPRVEPEGDLADIANWVYTAHVEVRPEIAAIDLGKLALTRNLYPVAETALGEALERRRNENATLRTPESPRASVTTDSVTFDLKVSVDGAERAEFGAEGRTVEIGSGLLITELNDGLIGLEVGGKKDISVTFPETHARKELAGKTAVFHVTVTAIQEKVLPNLDDDFAKDLGEESLDGLKAKITAQLEQAAKERSDEELRNDAVEALVAQNPVSVPPSLVTQVLAQLQQEMVREARIRGIAPEGISDELKSEAESRVKAGLLLTEIAKVNGIQVTDADLNARMEEIAKETGRAVQRVRVEYREPQKRDMLIGAVLEDKVVALVLSKAAVTEKTAEAGK